MEDKKLKKKSRLAIVIGAGLLGIFLFVILGLIAIFQSDLPSLDQLHNIRPSLSARVLDKNGKLLKEFYKQRRLMIPYEKIPPYMTDCLLAVEDRRFYDHWGIDLRRLTGAFIHNLVSLDLTSQGASTLTQQLARSLFLSPEKIVSRKIKEALTAIKIEQTYSKQQILELYLNQHYFGKGAYGIEAAASTYFSKHANELTLPECAVLVGVLKSPNPYNPINHPDKAIRRRNIVYNALVDCGKLTRQAADSLSKIPLVVNPRDERNGTAPYFTEMIRQYLSERYGEDALYNSGLTVYTTLDESYQEYAEAAVKIKLAELQNQMQKYIKPGNPKYSQYTVSMPDETNPGKTYRAYKQIQAALLCIDNRTGAVLAYVGGRDFDQTKFNRVIQALRQPGSSFKPIVYTTAIDNGFRPTDLFMDSPIVLTAGGQEWRPSNFDEKFDGEMTLRDALKESRNLVAIKLMMEPTVTAEQVIDYAKKMGVTTKLTPVPSLAIGSCEVTLWDMTTVFSVFPNGGIRREPYYITKIADRYGTILDEKKKFEQEEVLSPQTAYIMTNMLQTVINNGTGHPARAMGFDRSAGGKTGTTNEHTDNWFIGFTPQITCAVWVGYDDKTTIGIWKGEVGSTTALPIWTEFMKSACSELPAEDFVVPDGIFTASICLESGKLASPRCSRVVTDVFTERTLPKSQCDLKHYGDSSARDKEGRFKSDEDKGKKRF